MDTIGDFYIACIYYDNARGTCTGYRIQYARDECFMCPIKFEMKRLFGGNPQTQSKPSQNCYNNNGSDECCTCSSKRAGKGKVCYKSNKLSKADQLSKKRKKRKGTFAEMRRLEKVRAFDRTMGESNAKK